MPLPPGHDHRGVAARERRAAVGVAEQVLVEAGQQAHGAGGRLEAGAEVVARALQLEFVELLARGSDSGARIGEGQG